MLAFGLPSKQHLVDFPIDDEDKAWGAGDAELTSEIEVLGNIDADQVAVRLKERHIVWANPAFEKMLGYSKGELAGTSTRLNYASDASYDAFGAKAYAALTMGDVFHTEVEHRRKDGKLIWVDISGESLSQESGESLWSFVDITERKAAESQLILSEAKIKGVIEGAADAIFIANRAGKYQYINQEAI